MTKWLLRILVGGLLALTTVAPMLSSLPAAAATAPASAGSPGQGLEISPPVIQLSANPGQTITTEIRVRNVTQGVLIAKGRADDFGAGTDESGQPKLLLNETGATRYSLKYWLSGIPDITLAPQELKSATVTIAVPANAEPGGHFGLVRFTAVPPSLAGTGVALSASVGTLILLKVSGAITHKVTVAQFSTGQQLKANWVNKSFFEYGPVDFLVRVKDEGTIHEQAEGSIAVTDVFGRKVASIAVNNKGGNVLPDSIRRFQVTLAEKKLFGHYTAKLAMTYAGNQKLASTIGFWVIPWKLLLLLLLGLVVFIYLLKLGLKKYNDHIIAQARRR